MKITAMRFLVCTTCRSGLRLDGEFWDGSEVVTGRLICRTCCRVFPIVGGIPRFVDHGSYASSFGTQWNWFRTVQLDSMSGGSESARTLAETTGWGPRDYKGRLVLDAGVGAGRFAEVAADNGGEVVGVDVTTAVEAAYANIGRRPNVHLVQADIFDLPFSDGTFDLAYSVGVLHHTDNPRAAFYCVAAAVRPGGGLGVYLYHDYGAGRLPADMIRAVTTRLPLGLMRALSTVAIPLYYVYRLPVLRWLQLVFPVSMHPQWRWRWLDTFDWYTPKYQFKFMYPEVYRWFRNGGFDDVEIFDDPIRMRGTKAGEMLAPGVASTAGETVAPGVASTVTRIQRALAV
jgi:SAM-dependent methyltransferase